MAEQIKDLSRWKSFCLKSCFFTVCDKNVGHPTAGIGITLNRNFDMMVFVIHCPPQLLPSLLSRKSLILRRATSMPHSKKGGCNGARAKWSSFTKAIASRFQSW
jgi:hypothetical protein